MANLMLILYQIETPETLGTCVSAYNDYSGTDAARLKCVLMKHHGVL